MIHFNPNVLEKELKLLRQYSPSVVGSLLFSHDGILLAEDLLHRLNEKKAAAKAIAMLALAERISFELGRGNLKQIFLGGEAGHVIVTLINENTALAVICEKQVRVAMVLLDIAYTVKTLRLLL